VLIHTKSSSSGPESVFETTNQASTKYGDFAANQPLSGPRSLRREQELLEHAKQIYEQQEAQRQQEERSQIPSGTTTKSSYLPLDPALLVNSTRVPRGHNGARVVDPSIQHLTKREVDAIDQMKLDLLQGSAVTRYSHAIVTGVGLDFITSASDSANPFGRSSTFTNEITDPSKRHGEAMEPGSTLDERIGTNLYQRSALKRLVTALQQDPVIVRQFTEVLQSRMQGEFIQISDFRAVCGEFQNQLRLHDKDAIHMFMYFDVQSIGVIHLPQFLEFCCNPNGSSYQNLST
jgi:hypothetical protein